jgi:hypothetical protein
VAQRGSSALSASRAGGSPEIERTAISSGVPHTQQVRSQLILPTETAPVRRLGWSTARCYLLR